MKKYSQFEKGLIIRITEGVNTMAGLCKEFLNRARINVKKYDNNVEIMIPEEIHDISTITELIDDISRKTLTAVRLIEQLSKEGYIILYKSSNKTEDPFTFGLEFNHTVFKYYQFPDQYMVDLLVSYIDKHILVTQSLQEYVNFGFMSEDEIIQSQKIRAAWYTVYVSLFIGISIIIINIYFTVSKDTKIDRAQFDIIINRTNTCISGE